MWSVNKWIWFAFVLKYCIHNAITLQQRKMFLLPLCSVSCLKGKQKQQRICKTHTQTERKGKKTTTAWLQYTKGKGTPYLISDICKCFKALHATVRRKREETIFQEGGAMKSEPCQSYCISKQHQKLSVTSAVKWKHEENETNSEGKVSARLCGDICLLSNLPAG